MFLFYNYSLQLLTLFTRNNVGLNIKFVNDDECEHSGIYNI